MKKKNNEKEEINLEETNEIIDENEQIGNIESEMIEETDNKLLENTNQEENNINKIINNQLPQKPEKTKKEQKEFNARLFINYIGKNYKKIMQEKFSFPAFFFNGLYLIYRKMYILGIGLYFFLIFLASIFSDNLIMSIIITVIYIIISVLLGIFTNKRYCEIAYEQCIEINEKYNYISDAAIIKLCKRRGGTNIAAVIATIILASGIAIPSAFVVRTLTGIEFKESGNVITDTNKHTTKDSVSNNTNKNNTQSVSGTNQLDSSDEYFVISYNTETNIDNEYTIKLPSNFIENSIDTYEKNFKVLVDNNKKSFCEFNFSQLDGYKDANKFLNDYIKFKKISKPTTKKINGMTWNEINFKDFDKNIIYSVTQKDKKVYLLELKVNDNTNLNDCNKYYNEVLKSIKKK